VFDNDTDDGNYKGGWW